MFLREHNQICPLKIASSDRADLKYEYRESPGENLEAEEE